MLCAYTKHCEISSKYLHFRSYWVITKMSVDFIPFLCVLKNESLQINSENTWKLEILHIKKLSFAGGLKQYSLKVAQTCSNISYSLAVHTLKVFATWRQYIGIKECEKDIWENLMENLMNGSCVRDENKAYAIYSPKHLFF